MVSRCKEGLPSQCRRRAACTKIPCMLSVAAGDTGASAAHAEMGRRMPPPDLSAIPIGAYAPRNIMKDQHCDPEEAVQIHKVHGKPPLLFSTLAG